MPEIVLATTSLSVSYGKLEAVRDVSLSVPAATVVGLVGPNSAGKSSLLEAVVGASPGRCVGAVRFGSDQVERMSTHDRSVAGLRLVPQGRQLFPSLSVTENLRVVVDEIGEDWDESWARAVDMFPEVFRDRPKDLAGNLSGGQQQMVALARAVVGSPRVVLLDEPALGLAASIVQRVRDFARDLASDGVAVVIADQSLHLWEDTVSEAFVLIRGSLEGSVADQAELSAVLGHA